jgi:predicted RNase H-like HicB family nuclease
MDDPVSTRYFVMIRRTRTGYSVDVPDLDGCVATGLTVEHARQMIAEAIEMHLEMMEQAGEAIPAPRQKMELAIDDEAGEEFCTWVEVRMPQPAAPERTG